MANMHEIKLRIKSVKETRQITKAMKLISAAKLRKARQQLETALPYFEKVKATMADILLHSSNIDNPFFDLRNEKQGKRKAYVVLTGDKGLAGGYNHNIIKLAEDVLKGDKDIPLLVAGDVGKSYFSRKNYHVAAEFDYPVQSHTTFRAREIGEFILEKFQDGTVDEIYIIYTHMVSSLNLKPTMIKLLPLEPGSLLAGPDGTQAEGIKHTEVIVYEPSPADVLGVLVPKYVKGIVYGTLVEAFTSEQSARMTAMDSATANADDMLYKLNLFYNRARQAAITQEISEIVGGAAALK